MKTKAARKVKKTSPEVSQKIRTNILALIPDENEIRTVQPLELVSGARFDLMAKLIYARHREMGVQSDWARRLYGEHLQVFNGLYEPDGSGKIGLEAFTSAFDQTLADIKEKGFDERAGLIPVGRNNVLLDGSHRLAACLLYNRPVAGLFCDVDAFVYDYNFFKNYRRHTPEGLSDRSADAMALEYCRLKPNTYIVSVFPSAVGSDERVKEILLNNGQIIYEKQVQLSGFGPLYLMKQMYWREAWVGTWRDNYPGAKLKADLCFRRPGPVRVYVLETNDLKNVQAAKQQIRDLYKIENHSVHINDRHEETVRLAEIYFVENSLNFLNRARPAYFEGFEQLLEQYRGWIEANGYDRQQFCIDSSSVLAIYGIRPARDLDFLTAHPAQPESGHPLVNNHQTEIGYYPIGRDEIIYNPENHFYYDGLRFATLEAVRAMKVKRDEPKDRQDVALIEAFLNPGSTSPGAAPAAGFVRLETKSSGLRPRIINYVYAHTQASGFAVHKGPVSLVWSQVPIDGCDVYAYQDAFSYQGRRSGTDVLLLHEPFVVLPGQYGKDVLQRFDHIFTWADELVKQGGRLQKFLLPAWDLPLDGQYTRTVDLGYRINPEEKKHAICMIHGNKFSRIPGEMYSTRVELARWFYEHSDIPLDVYGRPAFTQLPNYRGELTPHNQKFVTLAQYRYCLSMDNTYHPFWSSGYFTRELLDCMMCETVPIYMGCFNVEQYLPSDCFIDLRNFEDYAELDRYLHAISDTQYLEYLDNIRQWVEAGNLQRYSIHNSYDQLLQLVEPGVSRAELQQMSWELGPADEHRSRQWTVTPAAPAWSWGELAGTLPADLTSQVLDSLVADPPFQDKRYQMWLKVRAAHLERCPEWKGHLETYLQSKPGGAAAEPRPTPAVPGAAAERLPLTTIVILNYNGGDMIHQCLESIKKNTQAPYEILVIDNASTDGSRDYLRQRPEITLVENKVNLGCPPARTQAMALARGEFVLLLDNDTIVTPGWLETLVRHMLANPRVGMIGPRSNYVSGMQLVPNVPYRDYAGLEKFARQWCEQYRGQLTVSYRLVGFCMLIRRAVIDKIGAPDPQFGKFGFEDDDFTWRAQIAGFQAAIANDVFIHHTGGPQGRGSQEYNQLLLQAWDIFKRKWGLPGELKYGAPFDLGALLQQPFTPQRHYVAIPERAQVEALIHHQAKGAEVEAAVQVIAWTPPEERTNPAACLANLERYTPSEQAVVQVMGAPGWSQDTVEAALAAALQSSYDYIVLLSTDVLVTPDWLKTLLEIARSEDSLAALGPGSNAAPKPQRVRPDYASIKKELQKFAGRRLRRHGQEWQPAPYLGGFCLLLKRKAVLEAGGIDAARPLPEALWQLFRLLKENNYQLGWAPGVYVHHETLSSSEGADYDEIGALEQRITGLLAAGQAALAQGDLETAANQFEALAEAAPGLVLGHGALGSVRLAQGENRLAAQSLRQALALAPQDAGLHNQLGVALYRDGQVTAAGVEFRSVLALDPGNIDALLSLCELHRAQEEYGPASEYLRRAVEADPSHPVVLETFANFSLEVGNQAGAEAALRRLQQADPGNPAIQALQEALGQPSQPQATQVVAAPPPATTTQPAADKHPAHPSQQPDTPAYSSWNSTELHVRTISPDTGLIEVNGIQGFLGVGDMNLLYEKAQNLPANGTIVEIGSFMGLSAVVMALALRSRGNQGAQIYCIDPWEDKYLHGLGIQEPRGLYGAFLNNIHKAGMEAFIRPLRRFSVEAAADFNDGTIDLLFIDGDHSYEGCAADLQAWYSKVKPRGVVIGHDCQPGSGVEQAVQQFCQVQGLSFTVHRPPRANHIFELHHSP